MNAVEPISMTNGDGIIFLGVCCGAVFFVAWFFVCLTRESQRSHPSCRMRIVLTTTESEPVQTCDTARPFLAPSVSVPMNWPRSEASDQRAIATATARRGWWGSRTGS